MCTSDKIQMHTEEVLKERGITEGQCILDCCCGTEAYTIAAAVPAGKFGEACV